GDSSGARIRSQFRHRRNRDETQASGRDVRAKKQARDGSLDHATRRAILYGQLSGWYVQGKERGCLWQTNGILPGDAAFSRLSESPEISLDRSASGTILPIGNHLPFF